MKYHIYSCYYGYVGSVSAQDSSIAILLYMEYKMKDDILKKIDFGIIYIGGKMYKRKTYDTWILYVDYGQGWEFETQELTHKEYKENRKAYMENCIYPQKWIKKREKI